MRRAWQRSIVPVAGMVACLLLIAVAPLWAQNLGEAARKERARKQSERRRAVRVYTNEDLKRPRILDPQDQARALAAREKQKTAPAEETAQIPGFTPRPAEISLGDIARHYRLLKQMRERQELGEAPPLSAQPVLAMPSFGKSSLPPPPAAPTATMPEAPAVEFLSRATASQVAPATGKIRVRRGDSLWRIAKERLGSGGKWPEIAAANPEIRNPNRIRAGQSLRLPTGSRAGKRYQVRPGDSLWKLARAEFGRGAAWSCIAEVNPQISNPDRIHPGQTIVLPAGCMTAEQPLLSRATR